MTIIIDEIFELFSRFGSEQYGEDLSIGQHMLQSAVLARSLGAPGSLIAAALLHDIGYFVQAAEGVVGGGSDHESVGGAWLSRGFDVDVTAPIALHVEAKRYLCAIEPGYHGRLSEASRLSLATQGGVMTDGELKAFARRPASEAALLLRRCDDGGKDVAMEMTNLEPFREILTAALRKPA